MTQRRVKWFGLFFLFIFTITSCYGTKMTQTEVAEEFKGKPVSDILVLAITGNEDTRAYYENEFVDQLKAAGVDAISSVEAIPMPPDLELKKEAIIEAIDKYESDAVVVSHLIDAGEEEVYDRGALTFARYYGYYHTYYSVSRTPGYSSTTTEVMLETNLFDAKTEKLIWTGRSETYSKGTRDQIIDEVIRTIIKDLEKNKVIAPK